MKDEIQNRFNALSQRGTDLVRNLPRDQHGGTYWVEDNVPQYQAWLSSVSNLFQIVAPEGNFYIEECTRLMKHRDMLNGVPSHIVQKVYGLLASAKEEWEHGLLGKIEYIVAAATFDDFIDHAAEYHKANKKIESSVLASAVLEDTVKKVAAKHNIATSGISLEPLIDALVKSNVFTPVKAKRVKGYAAVRNHALHAEWDKFDITDVGDLIKGTRELIEEFL